MNQSIKIHLMHHLRNAIMTLGGIWRNPFTSSMTILVIAIALALPFGLMLGLSQLNQFEKNWGNALQISIFLKKNANAQSLLQEWQTFYQHNSDVITIEYISPQVALDSLASTAGNINFLDYLDENPLPETIIFKLNTTISHSNALTIKASLLAHHDVAEVLLDLEWLQKIQSLLKIFHYVIYILMSILAFAVVLITSNTTRLELENKKENIAIAKLIGATDNFIRLEFLYLGFWQGFLGSIVASCILLFFMQWLKAPINHFLTLLNAQTQFTGLAFSEITLLLFLGSTLGLLGAFASILHHLRYLPDDLLYQE